MTRDEKVLARMEECLTKAEAFFHREFAHIRLEWGYCGGCAGKAFYGERKVLLHDNLFDTNEVDMLHETVPHEVAHIIVDDVFGRRNVDPHGEVWATVMRVVFGVEPTRCHSYDTQGIKRRGKVLIPTA